MEAFLLSIRDDYDSMSLEDVVIKYIADTEEIASKDSVKKTKMRLKKYGLWNKGEVRLDKAEMEICTYTLKEVNEIGPRELGRRIAEQFGINDGGARQKIAAMKKYGFLK